MELGIAGRVAVVTGASRGIGRAVAEALAAEGADLVVSARDRDSLDEAADRFRSYGTRVTPVPGDVTDPATTGAMARAALDGYGRADIVVNNAGGDSGHLPMDRLTDDDWELAYRLYVVSAMRLTVDVLPGMREAGWGRIVNVSSYTARVPEPFCAPYAAAKAALVNATRNLSRSYAAEGICANCVLPGLTDTDGVRKGFAAASSATGRSEEQLVARMLERAPIDAGRLGSSAEVAAMVVFLCSEQAGWITGAAVNVDGGTVRSAF